MKFATTVSFIVGFAMLVPVARAQEQLWITQFGTSSDDYAEGLAPDGAGGVFVAGITQGSLAGPNPGLQFLDDAFLARHDGDGNQLWIRQFGTDADERVAGVASDGAGGAIVAISTWEQMGVPLVGGNHIVLIHFDADGNQLWLTQFGSGEGEVAGAVVPDDAGGVFVGGQTGGGLAGPNMGGPDIFLARFDRDGNQLWVRQFGGASISYEETTGLAPDGVGCKYSAHHTKPGSERCMRGSGKLC